MAPKQLKNMMMIIPIDMSYCEVIGQIIVQWGALERFFVEFLGIMFAASKTTPERDWQFKKLEKRYRMFTEQIPLCFPEYPRIQKELNSIKDGMSNSQLDRNLLAHGRVGTIFPKKGPIRFHVSGRYKGQNHERDYQIADLRKLVTELAVTLGRFGMILSKDLDETCAPGWSQQELSALQDFRLNNRPNIPNPSKPEPQP